MYRTPYAKNPFDSVSDQEIEEYKRQVEQSQKGIPGKRVTSITSIIPITITDDLLTEKILN